MSTVGCLNPATLVNTRIGERIMLFRDGLWRGPEMIETQKTAPLSSRD